MTERTSRKRLSRKRKKNLRIGAAIILLLFLLSVVAVIAYMIGFNRPQSPQYEKGASYIEDETEEQKDNYSSYISIPCFDILDFIADTTTQYVNFYNPSKNEHISFRLTLVVSRGEGGEIIYQSDLLKPGMKISKIEISRKLAPGKYDATMLYQCFSEGGVALNNSKLDFTLNVKGE